MRTLWSGFSGLRPGILLLAIGGCTTLAPFEQKPDPNPQPPGTTPTVPPPDCTAYEYNGTTYDCTAMDTCTTDKDGNGTFADADDIAYAIACSECNPNYAAPDPTCPPPTTGTGTPPVLPGVETCMQCHNGANANDYSGGGISNPHAFGAAAYIACTSCHGGNGAGLGESGSHVPPPPSIGDRFFLTNDATAYFNYLTGTGLDKIPDYTVNGITYTALDYIQFMNPGDTRLTDAGRGCAAGGCHEDHAKSFNMGFINNEAGFYSNTMYTIGADLAIPANANLYGGSVADIGFRAKTDPTWVYDANVIGPVDRVIEAPEVAVYGDTGGFYQNAVYDANNLANFQYNANQQGNYVNQVVSLSPLVDVVMETVAFQCGDCHASSKGANNRYADFRSSGCTACHMRYSLDGRSRSTDPNVRRDEPANPDAIAAPERSHVESHQIRNVAKLLPNGTFIGGITDNACVGCHQGSNRTVLQYWGIRLDQNADVVNNFQYPANPNTFTTTQFDTRLFDPAVANATFNGRNFNQYLLAEDYDGDNRDDTPKDKHYEAGLGCIDCHGSVDLHNTMWKDNPAAVDPKKGHMLSKMDQQVRIQCESCHGTVSAVSETAPCEDYNGNTVECLMDSSGHPLRNTYRDANGDMWLTSRLDGVRHFVPQVRYAVVNQQRNHPLTNVSLYNPNASYAMGVADGQNQNGVGPIQTNPNLFAQGFTHMEAEGGALDCQSCHASWVNACIGCHLQLQYNANPANYFFSNTTGERITVQVTNADFTYIQPLWRMLTVSSRGKITNGQPGMKNFYRYVDLNGNLAAGIAFSDRNGMGNNPNYNGAGAIPMLSYNNISSHSIRGAQTAADEGGVECVGCHITQNAINNFGADYAVYFADIENRNYANLDFPLLQQHLGQNTNNHLDSPYYVHMVAGLGSGLMATDEFGCPVNPLDANANRQFCANGAPADNFANAVNAIVYDMDKAVEFAGGTNASLTKPFIENAALGVNLRSLGNAGFSGPMAPTLLQKLADPAVGVYLDSWIDANGQAQGDAANYINN